MNAAFIAYVGNNCYCVKMPMVAYASTVWHDIQDEINRMRLSLSAAQSCSSQLQRTRANEPHPGYYHGSHSASLQPRLLLPLTTAPARSTAQLPSTHTVTAMPPMPTHQALMTPPAAAQAAAADHPGQGGRE